MWEYTADNVLNKPKKFQLTFIVIIFLHPKEAATRVRAPIISGLRMFSKIIVMGKCSALVLEIRSVSISCLSKIAGNENKMI